MGCLEGVNHLGYGRVLEKVVIPPDPPPTGLPGAQNWCLWLTA